MMDFHNYWNKYRFLLSKYVKPGNSLFDIACGQGGDLKRWIDCGLSTVYGIDKVRNNIENPSSGMYSRLLKVDWKDVKTHDYVFGTMDASKEINESYVKSLEDKDDIYIGEKILKYGKFDLVSCQFAIHYFFESDKILDNYVKNVDRFLKDGGYFMGTCMDGMRVKKLLANTPKESAITGKQDDRFLWNITKLYDSEDAPTCGEQIKVYMESIGIDIPEYLVNTSLLIDKFKKYGIVPVEIRSFEDTYKEALAIDVEARNAYYHDAVKNMSDLEKTFSFMNIIFVFQKKGALEEEAVPIQKKKKVVVKKSI
jgi:mRNA (guanine-N7-)-methyltransferase